MTRYTLVIANKSYSSWSLRPWIFLRHHGIPFDEVRIPLYEDGYKARILAYSPAGNVPVLVDGATRVWETTSILEYLAERHPALAGWPADPAARAPARTVSAEMHAGFRSFRSNCPMNVRKVHAARQWPAEVLGDVARIDALWTDCRARFGAGGAFLFGAFSAADCMYAPVVWRMHGYSHRLSGPASEYVKTMLALPAMRNWHEGAMAEKEVIAQYEMPG
jgi:glutathione S-transferase